MSALEQAARMALDTLEQLQGGCTDSDDGTVEAITVWCPEVIEALRAALDAGQAQPVAVMRTWHKGGDRHADLWEWLDGIDSLPDGEHHLYASPPARQALTDEQIRDLWSWSGTAEAEQSATTQQHAFARAIERAHGIT